MTGGQVDDALDDEDWAAVAEADAGLDWAEGISLEGLKADFARRFGTRL